MSEIKTNSKDLLLLGRSWEYITLPSDRRFLEKYFTTDIQTKFNITKIVTKTGKIKEVEICD